jgi:hypothetical protein
MAERRALIEGLSEENRAREREFVYESPSRHDAKEASEPTEPGSSALLSSAPLTGPTPSTSLTGPGRVPVGARVRTELASALKRASLERQLQGIHPHAVQDILEESIELWLKTNKHSLR